MSIATTLREAAQRLQIELAMDSSLARFESEWLLGHVLARDRAWLFAHAVDALDAEQVRRFETLVERRCSGEPVAYLTGVRGFWSLDLEVDRATLIPRPETETLVQAVLDRLAAEQSWSLADLGTGSGAIALALASERPGWIITATDFSDDALTVAKRNALRLGLEQVRFVHGRWYEALRNQCFDVLLSNPPYIAVDDPHLRQGDLRFEPASALVSGDDGLDDIRELVAGAAAHLNAGGWLMVEHGHEQGGDVADLFRRSGLVDVETLRDLEERDRVTVGRRPGSFA